MSGEDHQEQPMAEDGSNGGSSSPSPGDTLPWNLGKTQRSRRRGGGSGGNGSVLDPAERAVIRIAGNAVGLVCSACSLWLVDRAPAVCRCMTEETASPVPGDCRQHSATCWPHPVCCRRPKVELAAVAPSLVRPQGSSAQIPRYFLGSWGRVAS